MDLASLEPEIAASLSRRASSANGSSALRCCCGKTDCAFLVHGNVALDGLERDVRAAAKVGQALLVRHEAFVADAEQERARLTGTVAALEQTTQDLEKKNEQLHKENESLHEQVYDLTVKVDESETHITSLTATLNSTQLELQKLTHLASRAETLEAQLLQVESEQSLLQSTLAITEEEKRAAVQRWNASQRKIVELEEQMERIEEEAKTERERHARVVEQMERRRAFDKELDANGGRMVGIAGAAGQLEGGRSEIVSNFVKDILQENANLQLNMVEMQELLAQTNHELEVLQQQASGNPEFEEIDRRAIAKNLGQELDLLQPNRQISQELHVHHHYHPASQHARLKARPQINHRPSTKRTKPRGGLLTSGRTTPSISDPNEHRHNPSIDSIPELSANVQLHRPRPRPNRWSTHSSQSRSSMAISSGPSSPQSTSYCPSTIFERTSFGGIDGDGGTEYSRPTSPETDIWSPHLYATPMQKNAAAVGEEAYFQPMSLPAQPSLLSTIADTDSDMPTVPELASSRQPSPPPPPRQPSPPNPLRRTPSTTSLLSISGMTLHSTSPSRRAHPCLTHAPSLGTLTHDKPSASGAVVTTTSAIYRASAGQESRRISTALRSHQIIPSNAVTGAAGYDPLADTFGGFRKVGKVGGWIAKRAFRVGRVVEEVVAEEEEAVRTSVEGEFDKEALEECLTGAAEGLHGLDHAHGLGHGEERKEGDECCC